MNYYLVLITSAIIILSSSNALAVRGHFMDDLDSFTGSFEASQSCVDSLVGLPKELSELIDASEDIRARYFMQALARTPEFIEIAQRRLKKHKNFLDFLNPYSVDLDLLSQVDQWRVIFFYVEKMLQKNEGEDLNLKQSLAFFKELVHRGHKDIEKENVYSDIKKISIKNLQNWLVSLAAMGLHEREISKAEQALIDNIVSDIEVTFIHNSTEEFSSLLSNLLSSNVIEDIGTYPTANASHFNKDFLKSADNVFFHFVTYRKSHGQALVKSEYGDVNWILDRDYAIERAFVSPFVMYPRELIELVRVNSSDVFNELLDSGAIKKMSPDAPPTVVKGYSGPVWEKALVSQSDFDLTVLDAIKLVKTLLNFQLQKLFQEDIRRYRGLIDALNQPKESQQALKDIIFKDVGLKEGLELKVPVAVPREKLKIVISR